MFSVRYLERSSIKGQARDDEHEGQHLTLNKYLSMQPTSLFTISFMDNTPEKKDLFIIHG